MQKRLLALYSGGHFLVDFTCAYLMLTLVMQHSEVTLPALLIYNFCAFALQMPCGLLADGLNRNALIAVTGLALTLISFALFPVPLLCAAILGVGNCLYHVGGGVDVLHFSDTQHRMLGIYISPGAIGLFLGGLLAERGILSLPLGFLCIAVVAVLLVLGLNFTYSLGRKSTQPPVSIRPVGRWPYLAAIALFLVVVLRSYAGLTQTYVWKTGVWVPLAVVGLALGKVIGGFLADALGAMRASLITLSLSTILCFFSANPICGLLTILLFNMTMPLTLFAMAQLFPAARGFAFGTLTFALFIGYLPTALSLPAPFSGCGWWYAVETLVSLALLVVGLYACRKTGGGNHV